MSRPVQVAREFLDNRMRRKSEIGFSTEQEKGVDGEGEITVAFLLHNDDKKVCL